jgi:NDP-mannose synthase
MDGGGTVLASRPWQATEGAPALGLRAPLLGTTRAVVLAGGLGMRLRPYTMVLPKPLIPIGDRPILEHIVRRLAASGVSLGTAGALQTIPDLDTPFIATNGDILTTVDFRALLAVHMEQQAALTIAMRRERVKVGLGVIDCEDGRITGYREKPSLHHDVSTGSMSTARGRSVSCLARVRFSSRSWCYACSRRESAWCPFGRTRSGSTSGPFRSTSAPCATSRVARNSSSHTCDG